MPYKFKKYFRQQDIETCGEIEDWESWLCSKKLGLTKKEIAKASKFVGYSDDEDCDGCEICNGGDGDFQLRLKNGRLLGSYQTEESIRFYITDEKDLTCDKVCLLIGGCYNTTKKQLDKLIKKYCVEISEEQAEELEDKDIPVIYQEE